MIFSTKPSQGRARLTQAQEASHSHWCLLSAPIVLFQAELAAQIKCPIAHRNGCGAVVGDSWVELSRVLPSGHGSRTLIHPAPKGGAPFSLGEEGRTLNQEKASRPVSNREQSRVGPRSSAFSLRRVGAFERPLRRGMTWLKARGLRGRWSWTEVDYQTTKRPGERAQKLRLKLGVELEGISSRGEDRTRGHALSSHSFPFSANPTSDSTDRPRGLRVTPRRGVFLSCSLLCPHSLHQGLASRTYSLTTVD